MSSQQFNPQNDNIIIKVDSLEEIKTFSIKGENGSTIELEGSNRLTKNPMDYIKENGTVIASNTEGIKEGNVVYFFYNNLENDDSKLDEANKIFSIRHSSLIAVEMKCKATDINTGKVTPFEKLVPLNDWVLADWVYEDGVEIENGIAFKKLGSLVIPCEDKPLANTARIVYCHDEDMVGKTVLIDKAYRTKTFSVINGKKMLRFKYEDIHAILD
jgi:hypothetical protein